ncbi:MAG: hypothetical protein QG670_543 [Thermoproteota archaeon]|nr:hypothetical protein [Thermoproteota archaeon]
MLPKILATPKNVVQPKQVLDYKAFKERFIKDSDSELSTIERFYAVRSLIEQDCPRILVNAKLTVSTKTKKKIITTDVCGEFDNHIVVAFCETSQPTRELHEKLKLIDSMENVATLLFYPLTVDTHILMQWFSEDFDSGKIAIEEVPWLSDEFGIFEEALELITLIGNRTRVKMLLPLLRESRKKSQFRIHVNPKLVYENISTLMEHRLVDEPEKDEYALTPIGRQILCEYLAFIQKVKKTLETQSDRR